MKENNENGSLDHEESIQDGINVINIGAKNRLARKKKKLSRVGMALLMGFGFLIVVVAVALSTVFKITSIEIQGCTYYSETEILNAIGLEEGDSIFFLNEKKCASALSVKYPMIYSVKVYKIFPSGVRIKITEETPLYRFEYATSHAVVSANGKVLYLGTQLPKEFEDVLEAKVPEVSQAVAGYFIKYKNEADKEAVEQVVTQLMKCNFSQEIVSLEMKSRFDIKVQYSERFTILFGDRTELDVKIKFVEGIVETLVKGEKGTINVKNAKKGYLILN